jgi:hypothetical protein
MKKNPDSKRITRPQIWKFISYVVHTDNNTPRVTRFYVNCETNKVKKVNGRGEIIISCPIELDYIICRHLWLERSDVLITWKLIEIINGMFNDCCNKCHLWKEYDQLSDNERNIYISEGILPGSGAFLPNMVDTHYHISKLYTA